MSSGTDTSRSQLPALLFLIVAYLALVVPVILSGRQGTSEAADQRRYHWPVIETMLEQWPHVDLVEYRSTTAPGYHLGLAVVARYASESMLVLRLVNAAVGLALILVVWRGAARYAGAAPAAALALPVLGSTYVLGGAIWLTTDNAALLFVCLVVAGVVAAPPTVRRLAAWGLCATLAVMTRQIHLWVVAPIAIAAVMASPLATLAPPALQRGPERSWTVLVWAAIAVAVPLAALGWLVIRWGGLTPPAYADLHAAGINPANLALILALFGLFGLFYATVFTVSPARILRSDRVAVAAAAIGLLVVLAMPTGYDKAAGRWGGALWVVVDAFPVVGGRSVLLPPLAALGAVVLVRLWQQCLVAGRGPEALLIILAIIAWATAQSANTQAWQRYCEPFVLIALTWLSALARTDWRGRAWAIGPLLLGSAQLALSVWRLYLPVISWEPPG